MTTDPSVSTTAPGEIVHPESLRGRSLRRAPLARRARRRKLRAAALLAVTLAGVFCALEWRAVPAVATLLRDREASSVLLARDGSLLRMNAASDGRLVPWAALEDIHPDVVLATIAAEDERFRFHPGVDPIAVARAVCSNIVSGRIVSGASTITMQVARLLHPVPRTFRGKFREALLAFKLEAALSKDEILELYLNLSPYGGNVHGVEGAARKYFGRGARDLSLSEAALIAGLPQAPSRFRPDRHPAAARRRRDWILDRLVEIDLVTRERCEEARAMPIRAENHALPFVAPHFTRWALEQVPGGRRTRTTLDLETQRSVERLLARQLTALTPDGVRNATALVVETPSGRIRAWVGSQDFFEPRAGQVDGVTARRSPGSLLKPFIYALAFERGLATPDARVDDAPRRYRDGYEPVNFERRFAGPITARDALVRSLNTPAVALLEAVGIDETLALLASCGFRGIAPDPDRYGLALALGGVDVPLLEVVEAYATLARLGLHRPLVFDEDAASAPARRVLSESAARQLADVLEGAGWSDAERHGGMKLPRLALKTGTSFKLRDAWAVAYSPRFTVGVWFGNFEGDASPALVGRSAAAPAALAIARCVHAAPDIGTIGPEWYGEPSPGAERAPSAIQTVVPISPAAPIARRTLAWLDPPDGATFARHSLRGGETLPLAAVFDAAGNAAWFVDDVFAGRTASGETLRRPLEPGTHRITLVTPDGESFVRTVRVE